MFSVNGAYLLLRDVTVKFSISLFNFYLVDSIKKKRMNAFVFRPLVPFPQFQLAHTAFDGIIYYIFIFDNIRSPKLCQRFLKF